MLRKSEWIMDRRPIRAVCSIAQAHYDWKEWLDRHKSFKERWLMSIIELLLKNQDWPGAYLLIQTYITTCKQAEGIKYANRDPFTESAHIRAVRLWFLHAAGEYGFAEKEEIPYDEKDIDTRRALEQRAEESYPFVGGKPKRRYSQSAEFFKQVEEDRSLHSKVYRSPDTPRKEKKPTLKAERARAYDEYLAGGGKPRGWTKGKPRGKPEPPV